MLAVLVLLVGIIAAADYVFQAQRARPGDPVAWRFFRNDNLDHLGERIALLSILAIGEAVVIIAGGIDLSVGSLIGLTALACTELTAQHRWPLAGALVVAWLVAVAAGSLQGALISGLNLQPFIVTLGGMMLFRGVSETMSEGSNIGYGEDFPGFKAWGKSPHQVLVLAGVAGLAFLVMRQTLFGRYCYAAGSNAEAARLSGVPVRRVRFFTYVLSGALAGLAGILYSVYLPSSAPSTGETYELYAIAAAVLGGCSLRGGQGSVLGVLIGASIMRVIDNGNNLLIGSPYWERTIVGCTILIAAGVDEVLARRRAR